MVTVFCKCGKNMDQIGLQNTISKFLWWKSDTSLLIPLTSLDVLHPSPSMLHPFQCMRCLSFLSCLGCILPCILWLHHEWWGAVGHVALAWQWHVHCRVAVEWLRRWGGFGQSTMVDWACSGISIEYRLSYLWSSFFIGWVIMMFCLLSQTLSPTANSGASLQWVL